MKNQYFISLVQGMKRTYKRFPIAMTLGIIATIYGGLLTEKVIEYGAYPSIQFLPIYLVYASVLSLVLTITLERYTLNNWVKNGIQVGVIGVGGIILQQLWPSLPNAFLTWDICNLTAYTISAVTLLTCLPFGHKNSSRAYINFSLRFAGYQVKANVVFGLLQMLCMGVFFTFMYMFFSDSKAFEHIGLLSLACHFGMFMYFAAQFTAAADIYDNETKRDFDIAKVLGFYIFLPVIAAYLFIVYLYCIKLIIKDITPEYSFIYGSILYFICLITAYLMYNETHKKKLAAFYVRWIWVLLLPVLAIMTIDYINYSKDGDNLLITLGGWYLAWLYGTTLCLFFTKSEKLKWVAFSWVVLPWVFLYTPAIGYKQAYKTTLEEKVQKNIEELGLLKEKDAFYWGELCNKLNEEQQSKCLKLHHDSACYIGEYGKLLAIKEEFNEAILMEATQYLKKHCVNFNASYLIVFYKHSFGTPMDSTYVDDPGYDRYRYTDITLIPDSILYRYIP